MIKIYVVRLSQSERETLNDLIKKQRVAAQRVLRAQVLLKADADGPRWTDAKIAEAFDCQRQTVEKIRERFVVEDSMLRSTASPNAGFAARVWMASKKPRSSRCGWGHRRKDSRTGR
jgi:hypothetical protein